MRRPAQQDIFAPIELEPLGTCPGEYSGSIATLIHKMLVEDPADRAHASELMDGWMGLFQQLCERTHSLEGRVF
jgi:hypothetical protein